MSIINTEEVVGFLLNSVTTYRILGKSFSVSYFKHWYAVRKLQNGLYFNLDSKLPRPVNIGNKNKLYEYLQTALDGGKTELLLVVRAEQVMMENSEDIINEKSEDKITNTNNDDIDEYNSTSRTSDGPDKIDNVDVPCFSNVSTGLGTSNDNDHNEPVNTLNTP